MWNSDNQTARPEKAGLIPIKYTDTMTPEQRKQFVQTYTQRHDIGTRALARICNTSQRTAQSWLDDGEHGRCPGAAVVQLLRVVGDPDAADE